MEETILNELKDIKQSIRDKIGKKIYVENKSKYGGHKKSFNGIISEVFDHVFTVKKATGTYTSFKYEDVLVSRHGGKSKFVF